ncbi:MAG: hypothetical protein R2695_19495 [Acidimicrobiales bacterium]
MVFDDLPPGFIGYYQDHRVPRQDVDARLDSLLTGSRTSSSARATVPVLGVARPSSRQP